MKRYLPVLAVAVVVLAGGALHGVWSDRWAPHSGERIARAGRLLKEFPARVGDWESTEQPWPEVEAAESVETTVTRRYVNRRTGEAVSVLMSCGNPRNLALFHTPLECYPALGYTLSHPTRTYPVDRARGAPPSRFLVCDFQKANGPLTQYVRLLWGYSGSGAWDVPEHPRVSYGSYRVLYKVYVTRPLDSPDEPLADDRCVAFLRELMPVCDKVLFEQR
jgi:hypothetical protein